MFQASLRASSAKTWSAAASSINETGAVWSAATNCARRPASTAPSPPRTTSAPTTLSTARRRNDQRQ